MSGEMLFIAQVYDNRVSMHSLHASESFFKCPIGYKFIYVKRI